MNGWFGRVVIGVVAIAIAGAATAGIIRAVRDDDRGADVVHVTGVGGATNGSGDNGTVVVVDRDHGWRGGPFFLLPILFLIFLIAVVFRRRHHHWGPGGWRAQHFEEWHRVAHGASAGGAGGSGAPGAGTPHVPPSGPPSGPA